MFVIHANLDVEATWAGVTLPAAVRARLGAIAPLLAALAPRDVEIADVEVWAPAELDPARLLAAPGWSPPTIRVGAPTSADLAWADPSAQAFNDRRGGLAVARQFGLALPGARVIASLDELAAHLAAGGAAASPTGRWVCKAPFTAAGRDRAHGQGDAGDAMRGELASRIANLLARHRELVFEPWLDRIADVGVVGEVTNELVISCAEPHGLRCDPRGGFLGIDTTEHALTAAEAGELQAVASAAGLVLARQGYRGPFGLDAFVHTEATAERRVHPLCEINARHTFGAVARALARRLGDAAATLGFSSPPPDDATVLVAPAAGDPVCAWVAPRAVRDTFSET